MSELAKKSDSKMAEVVASTTPAQLLALAVQQGADIQKLEKLMELQERWEANEARKAYHKAFSEFKSEAVAIIRNKLVSDGPLKGKRYADLYAVVDSVTPALSKHGLSASWRLSKDEKDWLEITCTITHTLGHSESVSMGGPPDTGGAKNSIQARASTVSYLERYTLLAATGLASKDMDNDGGGAGLPIITKEQALAIHAKLTDNDINVDKFNDWLRTELKCNKLEELPVQAFGTINKRIDSAIRAKAKK